ncbi:MAG: hypothetical protein GC160_05575 [Acidobacteria bacterium]|nr:hypothetical protein [Acidobacteriota bacterium]
MVRRSLLLLVALSVVGCSPKPETPWASYELEGTVVELKPAEKVAILDHGAIGDWMGAMQMGFPVRDPEEFAKLAEGMKIKATVKAKGYEEYYLENIVVSPPQ